MAGDHICRCNPAFWSYISTSDFFSNRRRTAVGHGTNGVRWVAHYIDDFITMGALGSEECASNSLLMHMACDQMGLPVEPDKDEGPASTLSFLGIELDSVAMEIRLPPEKLTRLREEIATWRARKKCKKITSLTNRPTISCGQSGPVKEIISPHTNRSIHDPHAFRALRTPQPLGQVRY